MAPIVQDQKIATSYIGRELTLTADIVDIPEIKNQQTRLHLGNLRVNNSINSINCQVYAILEQGNAQDLTRSDRIILRGKLQSGFGNYVAALYRPKVMAINKPDPPDYAVKIRTWFTKRLRRLFGDNDSVNLALGYLVGDRSLSDDFKEQLRMVGLSHIVVASGFSLSIIISLIKKRIGKYSHFLGTFLALALMVAFITITGLSASLLRAGIVSSLVLWSNYFGRHFHPFRLLIYAAAISGLYDPLIYQELAWQLSFASYAGIMIIAPLVRDFMYGRQPSGWVADSLIITFSAQLACIPLSIYYFGAFSVLGFLANLLITPTISYSMLFSFVGGITQLWPLIYLARAIARLHIMIIGYLSQISWAVVEAESGAPQVLLVYFLIVVFCFTLWRITKHSFKPKLAGNQELLAGKIYDC